MNTITLTPAQKVVAEAVINAVQDPQVMAFFSSPRTGKTFLFTNLEAYLRDRANPTYDGFLKWLYSKYISKAM